jgi:hypothetical protein
MSDSKNSTTKRKCSSAENRDAEMMTDSASDVDPRTMLRSGRLDFLVSLKSARRQGPVSAQSVAYDADDADGLDMRLTFWSSLLKKECLMAMDYTLPPQLVEIVANYVTGKDMHIDHGRSPIDVAVDTVPKRIRVRPEAHHHRPDQDSTPPNGSSWR